MTLKRFFLALTTVLFIQCSDSNKEAIEPLLTGIQEEVTYYSVKISATFEHADRILGGGCYFERSASNVEKIAGSISGNTLNCELTGLEPNTEYAFEVFYTNGQEERRLDRRTFKTDRAPCDEALWAWAVRHFDTNGDGNLSEAERAVVNNLNLADETVPILSCSGFELFPNVTTLYLDSPVLKTIDLSGLPKLDNGLVRGRSVEKIVFDNPVLGKFRIDGTLISDLDFTGAPNLENIEIYGVPFNAIHFDNNPMMDTFVLTGSKAEVIDMSMCLLMYRIDFGETPYLKKIILSKNSTFEILIVPDEVSIEYK